MNDYFVCGLCVNGEGDNVKLFSDGTSVFIISNYGVDAIAGLGDKFADYDDCDFSRINDFLNRQQVSATLVAYCGDDKWIVCLGDMLEINNYKSIDINSGDVTCVSMSTFDMYCLDEDSEEFYDLMSFVEKVGL